MPSFSRSEAKTKLAVMISGTVSDTDLNTILNNAVIETISDVNLRSTVRRTPLVPNLFDDIYEYSAPTDLRRGDLVDIQPQINRGRFDDWRLTVVEEFDRLKADQRLDRFGDPIINTKRNRWSGESLVAISDFDFVRKILISKPVDDDSITLDPFDSVGDWTAVGDAENLEADSANFVKGSASLSWDINADGGTTAGAVNASVSSTDISKYLDEGAIFLWIYLTSKTDVTNFIIRIGSSSAAYYSITVTTVNEGTSFRDGWNLIRWNMSDKSTTGSPDSEVITYIRILMTKDAGKVSENNYRFDHLVLKIGKHHNLLYYSKYGWQSSAGTYLEESTADTDLLNVDTDELKLILYKAAELGEMHIRNRTETNTKRQLYEKYMKEYAVLNSSQAMPLTNTYYNLDPLGLGGG